jgi:hypothetical protein
MCHVLNRGTETESKYLANKHLGYHLNAMLRCVLFLNFSILQYWKKIPHKSVGFEIPMFLLLKNNCLALFKV